MKQISTRILKFRLKKTERKMEKAQDLMDYNSVLIQGSRIKVLKELLEKRIYQ